MVLFTLPLTVVICGGENNMLYIGLVQVLNMSLAIKPYQWFERERENVFLDVVSLQWPCAKLEKKLVTFHCIVVT